MHESEKACTIEPRRRRAQKAAAADRRNVHVYAKVTSAGLFGMNAFLVEVETDLARGLPGFDVVGLPDAAVKESRYRVKAALKNTGFEVPTAKITVNRRPPSLPAQDRADLRPADLPFAAQGVRITAADFSGAVFLGELALDGSVRRVTGALPMTIMAAEKGFKRIFLPADNAAEASVVKGIEVYGCAVGAGGGELL